MFTSNFRINYIYNHRSQDLRSASILLITLINIRNSSDPGIRWYCFHSISVRRSTECGTRLCLKSMSCLTSTTSHITGLYHTLKIQHQLFFGEVSSMRRVNASVVQGSGIGPASYSIAESDLKPKNSVFSMFKFADDVDLITIIDHHDQIPAEMEHIEEWAEENNLILNKTKTKEIIFNKGRIVGPLPPPIAGIERVTSMKKLGVTLQSNLSMKIHVEDLISKCSNLIYPMNILRQHGMTHDGLQQVFNCKITSRPTYASPAWFGLAGQEEISRINAFLRRAARFGFYPVEGMTFQELCHTADDRLFNKITNNCNHVLHKFLPEKSKHTMNLGNEFVTINYL